MQKTIKIGDRIYTRHYSKHYWFLSDARERVAKLRKQGWGVAAIVPSVKFKSTVGKTETVFAGWYILYGKKIGDKG